jgi:glutamate-5-semialdehyde dehydrogenase
MEVKLWLSFAIISLMSKDNLDTNEQKALLEGLLEQIHTAKKNSAKMAMLAEGQKNYALELIERELRESTNYIIEANKKDLENPANADLPAAMRDRLLLDAKRIMSMANGIRKIINIKDPIANVLDGWRHPNGLKITKVRVPLGVIGIIYEARPNVTTDAVALAIKSGNAMVLRGSKQAIHTNSAIMDVVTRALKQTSVPIEAIQYLSDRTREGCKLLLGAVGLIDLVIPRGGETLNKFVTDNALVPVLGAGGGTCHLYIDEFADIDKAINIAINAKTSRPSVCNACESILIHETLKDVVLPLLAEKLLQYNVEILGDQGVQKSLPFAIPVTDWSKEHLDLKVSIKIVNSIEEAIEHINLYSTSHSETIVTEDRTHADMFMRMIDSACVYINASTRFTDGEEFGFGAEMGISTQKMHARGPIGVKELCSYKYIIEGNGQTR